MNFTAFITCSTLFMILSFYFVACNKEEACLKCNYAVDSTFTDYYFRLSLNANFKPVLILYDSSSLDGDSRDFELCVDDAIDTVEFTKIIRASGNFKRACKDNSTSLIELIELNVIDTCVPEIPQLIGNYSLLNDWLVHYIQTQDTIVYPPCEGYSNIIFSSSTVIGGNISENWFLGEYTEIDQTTIQMPENFTISLSVGTHSQVYYENLFLTVLEPNALISYSIDNNILTLENSSNSSLIKLYLKP